ncbi:MAG: hypothetical protein KDA25_05475 [Phycisphaerales bacterium]|nr:hypothetical protein [Phycisphaerales bacterium]
MSTVFECCLPQFNHLYETLTNRVVVVVAEIVHDLGDMPEGQRGTYQLAALQFGRGLFDGPQQNEVAIMVQGFESGLEDDHLLTRFFAQRGRKVRPGTLIHHREHGRGSDERHHDGREHAQSQPMITRRTRFAGRARLFPLRFQRTEVARQDVPRGVIQIRFGHH